MLGLALSPVTFVVSLFRVTSTVQDSGLEAALGDTRWLVLNLTYLLGSAVLSALALFILPKYFARRRTVPRLMQFFYAGLLASNLLDLGVASIVSTQIGEAVELSSTGPFSFIIPGLWLMYFRSSKQVHRTFVV